MSRVTHMQETSKTFTPAWAMLHVKSPETAQRFYYEPLDLGWREQVPTLYSDDTDEFIGMYIAWVKVVLAVTADGDPVSDTEMAHDLVTLCDALGHVMITTSRLQIKLDGGFFFGNPMPDSRSLVMSLKYDDVASLELQPKKKMLGGAKPGPSLLVFSGAGVGGMRITPERGLNTPYDSSDRGMWGRDVERQMFEDIAGAAFGDTPAPSQVELARPDVAPELRQFMHDVKNPFNS